MIIIENLSYTYQPGLPPALNNVSLQIGEGEYIALIGPNGCGKTTLIRHLNALLLPGSGKVVIDSLNSREVKNHLEIRRRVGMLFQNPDNQIVGMSVEEDVAFGPGNLKLPSTEVRRRVNRALATVGLSGFEKRMPYTLSGGEKQMLALAGLLAMDPAYIILDEATSSLDSGGKEKVLAILLELKSRGMSIIHVTHNMEEARRADRVILMDRAQVVDEGAPRDILIKGEQLKALGLAPPLIVELMERLRPDGHEIDKRVLTVDEAAAAINRWLQGSSEEFNDHRTRKAGGYA
jgi:biotin transport system ATP-binding protein/energy-coupling factor transport system ATP-binding protein